MADPPPEQATAPAWRPKPNGTRWGLAWWWYALMALCFGVPALFRVAGRSEGALGIVLDSAVVIISVGYLLVLPYELRNQRRYKGDAQR
jgi:hypothetical protein